MANPFLVLGGIAVGIVTAAFGVLQVPGWVASAQDAAAINDLANIRDAQAVLRSTNGTFTADFTMLSGSKPTASTAELPVATLALAHGGDGRFAPTSLASDAGKKTKQITFELSGGAKLDYLDVNDAADAYCAVVQSASGNFFAVGDGQTISEAGKTRDAAMDGATCAPDTRPAVEPEVPALPEGGNLVYTIRADSAQCQSPELRFNNDGGATVKAVINWGDNTGLAEAVAGVNTHTYAEQRDYTVTVTGKVPAINSIKGGKADCVTSVPVWEEAVGTTNASGMFFGATSLDEVASLPSTVTNTSSMFGEYAKVPNSIATWNTGNVKNMSYMFQSSRISAQDVSKWNTSSVTSMAQMFSGADKFNQDLGGWDVRNVKSMNSMFYSAYAFTGKGLERWKTDSLTSMAATFQGARVFNANINGWNVSKVTDFSTAFTDAVTFNQPLDEWKTTSATQMQRMFHRASAFAHDVSHFYVGALYNAEKNALDFATGSKLTAAQLPKFAS